MLWCLVLWCFGALCFGTSVPLGCLRRFPSPSPPLPSLPRQPLRIPGSSPSCRNSLRSFWLRAEQWFGLVWFGFFFIYLFIFFNLCPELSLLYSTEYSSRYVPRVDRYRYLLLLPPVLRSVYTIYLHIFYCDMIQLHPYKIVLPARTKRERDCKMHMKNPGEKR